MCDRDRQDRMSTCADSEAESDTSSVMGDTGNSMDSSSQASPAPLPHQALQSHEQLQNRIQSLIQENRVLKMEVDTYKLKLKSLQEENKSLKKASVLIQAKAEQEEEFISNTLLKKIKELKKEKETLALNYEQEEECLTNDLSRKLFQLRQEKMELAASLQQEQESLVNKLLRKIRKLETETQGKQAMLEQLRREKVQLENTLEQEQEALVNKLWKRMDKLEAEKRSLQENLEQPISAPPSPMDVQQQQQSLSNSSQSVPAAVSIPSPLAHGSRVGGGHLNDSAALAKHIQYLRNEVNKLKQQLKHSSDEHSQKMATLEREEQQIREENVRLQRKLQMEVERREQLCRHLSESESSLEMEDERHFNELAHGPGGPGSIRCRTVSSPVAGNTGNNSGVCSGRMSPAANYVTGLAVNTSLGGGGMCSPPSPMAGQTAALPQVPYGAVQHRCAVCGTCSPISWQAFLLAWQSGQVASNAAAGSTGGSLTASPNSQPHSLLLQSSGGAAGGGPVVRTRSIGSSAMPDSPSGSHGNRFVRPHDPPPPASPASPSSQPAAAQQPPST